MRKSGIVISPPFVPLPRGIRVSGCLEGAELRKYLLYWDVIDYPDNNIISMALCPDLQFLHDVGVLKRTLVRFSGSISVDSTIFISAQQTAFDVNSKNEPGQWSLAQASNSIFFPNAVNALAIEFSLKNMLPTPSAEVPLTDILEFKQKRQTELESLRVHLDDVYQLVINSADIPHAMNAQIRRLELSLADLNSTLNESKIKKTITSLRNYISGEFSSALGMGLGGAGISTFIGMSPLLAGCTYAH